MNTTTRQITNASTTAAHPTKCAYRSKPCPNTRAIKMNGEYHRLCEYHRRRANLNQQRVHQRRKLREMHKKQQEQVQQQAPLHFCVAPYPLPTFAWTSGLSSPTSADKCYDEDILGDNELTFDFELDCEPSLSPCGDLPLPDLEILERLLSDVSGPSWSALAMDQPECRVELFELDLSEI